MKTIFLIIFLIIGSFNLKAQNQLSIGKAFDLHKGDSLLYDANIWYYCYPYGFPEICNMDFGLRGFVVDSRIDYFDSIIYHVHLYGDSGSLVIKDLDSSVQYFQGLSGSYILSDKEFLSPILNSFNDVQYIMCDSTKCNHCSLDTSFSIVNGGWLIEADGGCGEEGGSKSLLKKCGLFEREYESINFPQGKGVGGGDDDKLVYYKTDSTVWMDSSYFTGVKDVKAVRQNDLTLYPNPVSAQLEISGYSQSGKEIQINDLLGRQLFNQSVNSNITMVDVSYLAPGIYFLTLRNKDDTMEAKKFMKE